MKSSQQGALIALAGVSILSFDSLLVRLIEASGWDLLFWRGALLSLTLLALNAVSRRQGSGFSVPRSPMIYLGGFAFSMSMVFFVLSVDNTQVASTLVIVNTAPFFAAILALLFLREKLPIHTVVAIAVATVGIWLIFEYAPTDSEIEGDIYALVAALGTAGYLVVMRAGGGENGATYLIVGGVITAALALMNGANPLALSGSSIIFMALLGCLVVPGSGLCIARATKYLPAAQAGLILLLEILLGPLFVYLALGEQPSGNDIEGGILILLTLAGHTLWEELRGRTSEGTVTSSVE